jgi:hypothetical protein
LEKQKDKLFGEGYNPMWEADFNSHDVEKADVVNNKDICKLLMLPKVIYPQMNGFNFDLGH